LRRRPQDAAPTLFDAPDAEPAPASTASVTPPGTSGRSQPGATSPALPGAAESASPAAAAAPSLAGTAASAASATSAAAAAHGLPGTPTPAGPAAAAVLKSAAYAAQKKIAGRVSVTDGQIRGLLDALLAAPGGRLVPAAAATALAVSPVLLRGAVLHAQRLLNADGYPVLRVDADGATVILDEGLLREQFGIRG